MKSLHKIYPSDVLSTHCLYDSTTRTKGTRLGVTAEDEMCMSYFLYYPAAPTGGSCNKNWNNAKARDGHPHVCDMPDLVDADREEFQDSASLDGI